MCSSDLRTGKERWRWDPEVNQTAVFPRICCGVVNRGLAIYQNLIIAPIIDGRLEALDANTGKVVWESPGEEVVYRPFFPWTTTVVETFGS